MSAGRRVQWCKRCGWESHLGTLAAHGGQYEASFGPVRLPSELVGQRGWISLRCLGGDMAKEAGHRRVFRGNLVAKVSEYMLQGKLADLEKAIVCDCLDDDCDACWKPYYVKFGFRGRALLAILLWFFEKEIVPPDWLTSLSVYPLSTEVP